MGARRHLVKLHVWLGLTFGAFWALQGLTGALMVFNRDIQPLLLQAAPAGGPFLPLDEIFARASRAADADVAMLETFTPKSHLLLAYFEGPADQTRQLVVDARSGAVLDRRSLETMVPSGGSSWYWLLRLHESLLAGERGLLIVGLSGLVMLSSVVVGLVIGWPRRGQWRQAYSAGRWRTAAQRLYGWHRAIGLTAGAALLLSATCGVYLAFAPNLRPMLAAADLYAMPFKPAPVERLSPPAITAQQALDIARARFPEAVMVRATRPTEKTPVYGFRLLQKGEWRRWAGTTTIFIDPSTGTVLKSYDPFNAPFFNRLNDNIYPVHTGEAGGLLLRLLVMFGGLALPTLYVTGVWAWLRRRRRRIARNDTVSIVALAE